jgi:hypothetical protein
VSGGVENGKEGATHFELVGKLVHLFVDLLRKLGRVPLTVQRAFI